MPNKNRNSSLPKKQDAVVEGKQSHKIKQRVVTRKKNLAVLVLKEAKPAIMICASVVLVAMSMRKAKGRNQHNAPTKSDGKERKSLHSLLHLLLKGVEELNI